MVTKKLTLSELRGIVREVIVEGYSSLALYNTNTDEVVGRSLDPEDVDYLMFKKNFIGRPYIKVIKNPSESEIDISDNGAIKFKSGHKPIFMEMSY